MTETLYNYSLIVAWTILFIFGSSLLMAKVPTQKAYDNYNRSRRIIGLALILFGVQVLLQWLFEFRTSAPHIATAMNITIFYMEGILFGMSFISLLDASYINCHRTCSDLYKWAACMAMLWTATLFLKGTLRTGIQIAAAAFFFWQACLITRSFFLAYHRAIYKVENYYADNVDGFVHWLYRSTLGIIFFGLTAAIIAFTPKWCIAIQMTAGIFMFFYIFLSFMNYMLNYNAVEIAVAEEERQPITAEDSSMIHHEGDCQDDSSRTIDDSDKEQQHRKKLLADSLDHWVAGKGFCENGITIEQVAEHISSNRTYLSGFINSEFKCTFRTWINNLRMEYAKQLLISCPKMPIEQIAREAGFSSGTSFGKLFNECEKMPPSKWRRLHPVEDVV